MANKTSACLIGLCLGLVLWLYYNVSSSSDINYEMHSILVNSTSGERRRPMDVLDLSKIIRPPTDDYLNETTAIDRGFHLAQKINYVKGHTQHSYSSARQLDQSGWPVANQTRCGLELTWIQGQLDGVHYSLLSGRLGHELAQLMDSFGKPGAGLYSGTLTWPGRYDACKRVSLDGARIRTRYCLAMLRLKPWPAQELGLPKTRIKLGICIPETCDTLSFDRQRERLDSLIKFDLNEFMRENLVLESMYCLPDERSPVRKLPTGGWIYLGLIISWLSIMFASSIVLLALGSANDDKLSQAPIFFKLLSLQQSWSTFISNPVSARRLKGQHARVDLASINIIKCLSALTFVYAHTYLIVSFYVNSLDHSIKSALSPIFYLSANISKLVDVFFMLFGLLAAYTSLRKLSPTKLSSLSHWFFYNCYTLIKISVIYVLLYWYAKTLEPYTGEGPWWDYGTYRYSFRGNCLQEPWWRSIPYFSDLGPRPKTTCVTVGWFVVSLAQIAIWVPAIIYLLYKLPPGPLYRCLLMAFFTAISSLQMVLKTRRQTTLRPEAFASYGGFVVNLFEQFEDTGTLASLGRLSTVAYGCYFGHLLHLYEINAISEWPGWIRSRLTLAMTIFGNLLVLFVPLIGKLIMDRTGYLAGVGDFLAAYLITMIVWPLLNGLLVLLAATVYNRAPLVQALGHPFWHTANKLVLGLYLIHWPVIMYLVTGFHDSPLMGTWLDVFKLTSLGCIISLALTIPTVVLLDIPLTSVLSLIVRSIQVSIEGFGPESRDSLKNTSPKKEQAQAQET